MNNPAAHPQGPSTESGRPGFPLWGQIPDAAGWRLIGKLGRRESPLRLPRLEMQDLVTANRRKDELLATVCHELRSPLATISHTMRLLSSPQHAAMKDEMQALILRQLSRMSTLVDDLLDASRIANGRLQLQRERLDLRDVVNDAIKAMTPELEARHHQLTVALPDQPVWLMADPLRLEQVFVNLLGNAAKYTEPGGRLELRIDVCAAQAVVRVRDSGIGIAPRLLPYVFELFRQADDATTQSKSGLGIGLAVVRQLVQLHGGSVTAASPGPGQGSEFAVRLLREDCASDEEQLLAPCSAGCGAAEDMRAVIGCGRPRQLAGGP